MYKPKGNSNSWYKTHANDPLPISTTHEMLIEGSQAVSKERPKKKQISFKTYPMDDDRLNMLVTPTILDHSTITQYNRDYKRPYGFVPRPFKNPHDKPTPDVLFNRLPVNQFGLYRDASTKFMDDQLFDMSENRKKINMFRQMRNTHYPLIA